MTNNEKALKLVQECLDDWPYAATRVDDIMMRLKQVKALLKEQEPRILSLGEAIDGKNGLEIDPYVFVEIKGREDIFIGEINDVSHYNYPNLTFGVGECFQINRSFPSSNNYLNTDYMKTVRCWTHKPSKEQRKAVKWE